jgi:GAF domain-containing protein
MDASRSINLLADFARQLARRDDVFGVLHHLAARMRDVLEVSGGSVSLVVDGELRLVATDEDSFADLGRVHGEGPSLTAMQTGSPVLVACLAEPVDKWPVYCRVASEHGTAAVAVLPLRAERVLGTIELYDRRRHDWTPEELRTAGVFADIAASYVRNASELDAQRRLAAQLQTALASRVIVEQAKGIVAANRGVTLERAFQILRKHSADHNTSLRKVAEAVVRLGLRP